MGSHKKEEVNPALYSAYRQLELEGLKRHEYRRFIKHIKSLPQYDGCGDSANKVVFFKFSTHKPNPINSVSQCKELNEKEATLIMMKLKQTISEFNYQIEWT